jgi:membrane protein
MANKSKQQTSIARTTGLLLKESLDGFMKDEGMRMSAALAYYSAFSLAPLLLIAVSIGGAFFGEDAVRGALDDELRRSMGEGAAMLLQDMVANARKPAENVLMSLSGIGLLLLGAAGLFGQLQAALNTIWDVGPPPAKGIRGFVRNHLVSFSMVLVTGFMLLVSMILTALLQALGERLGEITGIPLGAWSAGSGVLSFAVTALMFAAIFKILPNTQIEWREVWIGALFTAALFMVGKFAIGWYLGRAATSSSYGSAGSFVVILIWLYYSNMILLFGAEFTEVHARRKDTDGPPASPLPRQSIATTE